MGLVVVWGDSVEMNGIRHGGVWFGRSERDARARPIDGSGARGSERTARPRRSRQTRPQSSRCDRRAPNDTEVVSDTDA